MSATFTDGPADEPDVDDWTPDLGTTPLGAPTMLEVITDGDSQ